MSKKRNVVNVDFSKQNKRRQDGKEVAMMKTAVKRVKHQSVKHDLDSTYNETQKIKEQKTCGIVNESKKLGDMIHFSSKRMKRNEKFCKDNIR